MKTISPESVSDLVDQQLPVDDIDAPMQGIVSNPKAIKNWRNYHLIGDVIRGDVQSTGDCMIERMGAVLAAEPTILAPLKLTDEQIVKTPEKNGDVWKSVGMFAVAASVALMAVLTFSGADNGLRTNRATQIASAVPVAAPPTATPLNNVQQTVDGQVLASFESEFGQMMVEHGEFTATSGLNGLLTYAKLVSNENLGQ